MTLKTEIHLISEKINLILWTYWDPAGINFLGEETKYEYAVYVKPILDLLSQTTHVDCVIDKLEEIESSYFSEEFIDKSKLKEIAIMLTSSVFNGS